MDSVLSQLQAMAMLATLRTAAELRHALDERRAGRDPSDQEAAASAQRHLAEARAELRALLVRLRVSLLLVERDEATALAQAFEDRMLLARAERLAHGIHQRLLSLYPAAEPDVIEAARTVRDEAARLAVSDEDDFPEALAAWVEAAETVAR